MLLGVQLDQFPFSATAGDRFVQLARITPLKGQAVSARLGVPVTLAGHVEDDAYWHDEVAPYVDGDAVRYVGSVAGAERLELLGTAAGALFPVQWEEPGGTAVVVEGQLDRRALGRRLRSAVASAVTRPRQLKATSAPRAAGAVPPALLQHARRGRPRAGRAGWRLRAAAVARRSSVSSATATSAAPSHAAKRPTSSSMTPPPTTRTQRPARRRPGRGRSRRIPRRAACRRPFAQIGPMCATRTPSTGSTSAGSGTTRSRSGSATRPVWCPT